MKVDVGTLRQQTALSPSDRRVVVITDDPSLPALEVEEFFPDTTDERGQWTGGTFKIKVRRTRT